MKRSPAPTPDCPFCDRSSLDLVAECSRAVAFRDRFPVSRGHTLVVPKEHQTSLYACSPAMQDDVWELVAKVRAELRAELDPDGFNIGLNDGERAGQTIAHAHVHVIPRFGGDVPDPRGGIRWVVPDKAAYWNEAGQEPPPTASEQIEFLNNLQRLLAEGSFVATYKFALLHAIADLCVSRGDDSGAPLTLYTEEIAEQIIQLYWPQMSPFISGEEGLILRQTTGKGAAIVREVKERHARYQGSLSRLEQSSTDRARLVRTVRGTVEKMPLWKLQTVGSERLKFLYENADCGSSIELKPGVAYCFRAFYPMIIDMVEDGWSEFIQRVNPQILQAVSDLRSFLFGSERTSLGGYRDVLQRVQDDRCFYCERRVRERADVDHFIPWSRYPLDLGHNFVLTCMNCNSAKSNMLAAEEHLEKWVHRNRTPEAGLAAAFDERGLRYDLTATEQVAWWAYGQVYRAGGQVWLRRPELGPLSSGWSSVLETHATRSR